MSWWRRVTRADVADRVEAAADLAEARARLVAAQTRRLAQDPPPDLPLEDYADRVAAAFGRRP